MGSFALALALLLPAPQSLTPARHATCLRFYAFEGDPKPEALTQAVRALASPDFEARIAIGPVGASSRPKLRFLALEVPARTPAKTVEAAMKKVSSRAEELAWTEFEGAGASLPTILGYGPLDCVVGMDNDVRWFDLENGHARFFHVPGKLGADDLKSKFQKLYQPFQAGELGPLARDAIEWKLTKSPEKAAADAARKAIAKLPGVKEVKLDAAAKTLSVGIERTGLRAAAAGPADPARGIPATAFLQDEILDVLETAKIAVEP